MTDFPSGASIRPRLHVVSLPHTETTREYDWCAFTAKTRKFATMMTKAGYDVRLYAGEANEAVCAEHIPIISHAEQKKWFGHYDWTRDLFDAYEPTLEWWRVMNARAADEIRKRAQPGDILGLAMGFSQHPIAELLNDPGLYEVEIGIGYTKLSSPFRVFESYALRHFLSERVPNDDVRPFDTVIPNFFEIDAFPEGKGDGEYYLFLGRAIRRKGPLIAAEACRQIGAKLIVAGQNIIRTDPVTTAAGYVLEGNVEYVGMADPEMRAKLMGGAKAVFLPTVYLEPFGGVAVEAMICGTPVITSDWGAFTETVIDGVTGFRCNTIEEYAEAASRVGELDRKAIRKYAIDRFSTDVVGRQYDRYFQRLSKRFPQYVERQKNQPQIDLEAQRRRVEFSPTASGFLDLSLAYYKIKLYRDCITAAEEAVKLNPNYAEAYNNIAACYNALGQFDLAIEAAKKALRINGKFELAKGNLHSALDKLERQQGFHGHAYIEGKLPVFAIDRPGGNGDILASLNLIPAIRAANPGKEIWYFCDAWYAKPDNLGSTILAAGCDKVVDILELEYWRKRAEKFAGFWWPDDEDDFTGKPMAGTIKHLIDYFADRAGVPFNTNAFPSLRIRRPERRNAPDGDYATLQWKAKWSVYKEWPFERWQEVIAQLPFPVVVLDPETTPHMEDAIALVANARIHIGIDSFAQHLTNFTWLDPNGNGRKIPSVILWGSTQPRTAGYNHNTNIFLGLECQPCFRCAPDRPQRLVAKLCDNPPGQTYADPHHACMEGISVEPVVKAIREKWERAGK